MNELTGVIKVANGAFKAVKVIDVAKKVVLASATVICCAIVVNAYRRKR